MIWMVEPFPLGVLEADSPLREEPFHFVGEEADSPWQVERGRGGESFSISETTNLLYNYFFIINKMN